MSDDKLNIGNALIDRAFHFKKVIEGIKEKKIDENLHRSLMAGLFPLRLAHLYVCSRINSGGVDNEDFFYDLIFLFDLAFINYFHHSGSNFGNTLTGICLNRFNKDRYPVQKFHMVGVLGIIYKINDILFGINIGPLEENKKVSIKYCSQKEIELVYEAVNLSVIGIMLIKGQWITVDEEAEHERFLDDMISIIGWQF